MSSTPPIETERLRLRAVEPDDLDELVRLHEDPLVIRFMGSPDREWLGRWLRSSDEEWEERGHGRLAIVEKESGRFLGRTGLKHWPQFEETEIGWALHAEARGSGYATEAARAVLDWAVPRFDVPYFTAMIRPDNTASIAVAERLGMSPLRPDKLLGDPVTVYATRRRRQR
ncbi:MAG: GNAT family N-acetyltransferase [Solirubrobacterales bacterium]